MKPPLLSALCLVSLAGALHAADIAIPANFAMPAGSVDTTMPGFMVRPYKTAASQPNNLVWTEDQLLGLHGPNLADLSNADANGYLLVDSVVNWNIAAPKATDGLAPSEKFPGGVGGENISMEVLTYLEFPAAGTYTFGVNSDDGFRLAVAPRNPKDRFSSLTLGSFNGGRGAGDSLFSVSVSKAGIYPMRLIYEQGGGDASVVWFTVVTDENDNKNLILVNDVSNPAALKAYSTASAVPPFVQQFGHDAGGFSFTIKNEQSKLNAASLVVKLNGAKVDVTTTVDGDLNTINYSAKPLIGSASQNTVDISFADNGNPAQTSSVQLSYTEASYATVPQEFALPSSSVDEGSPGFSYRVHQIDPALSGTLAANVAHAEAQLAGFLTGSDGQPYANVASGGDQPDGSFIIPGVINFNLSTTPEQGVLTSGNGYPDEVFPGLESGGKNNIAVAITTYLELNAGFYNFGVTSADGFRLSVSDNPLSAFGETLGIFDFRRIVTETSFGVLVQKPGIYPVKLVYFRQGPMADNGSSSANLEFYTLRPDGSRVAVNDVTNPQSVKAYWKRTTPAGTYVRYAGPSSFISPFAGSDVGFRTMNVVINDGTADKVVPSSVVLKVDGATAPITTDNADGRTTLSYTPDGLQLPRTVHTALLTYRDDQGSSHSNTWQFNLLRNYVLPEPTYFEDFESTDAGPEPHVPQGWIEENHTGVEHVGFNPGDGNSDFYLGFVVIDKPMRGKKNGTSPFAPQVLNGVAFSEATNPLMAGHCVYAESDDRQNGPPGQIQYLTTPSYDMSGKSGVVIAFNSSYEQNQDNIAALEYTIDGGKTWHPITYWLQDGYDSQGVPDIIRDGLGTIDVSKTMLTEYGDVARYTDDKGALVGGYYGFYIKSPITPALAPYIEGRVNDDGSESKRVELFRVPLADNQASVQFRFSSPGTSSWYWGIDNWGVYSVPSLVGSPGPKLNVVRKDDNTATISWTGTGVLQSAPSVDGPWTDTLNQANPQDAGLNVFTVSLDGAQDGGGARTGSGKGTLTLLGSTLTFDSIPFSGLSGTVVASHIHGPAKVGSNAGVLYDLVPANVQTGANSGVYTGTLNLADKSGNGGATLAAQIDQLNNGLWYLNVHSTQFGGGEIRGQIVRGGATFYRLR